VIDADGFRPNVGIILANSGTQVLWAKRIRQEAWQFPQGGIQRNETPQQALYRELEEELGLKPEHVSLLGVTEDWLRYRLPARLIRRGRHPVCIGQKQKWFLLRMNCEECQVRFDATGHPEFDSWRWVDFWHPVREVVAFKREVYREALNQLAPLLGLARSEGPAQA
jgi:putative (di)nucleoside polyphosphate hydrolase